MGSILIGENRFTQRRLLISRLALISGVLALIFYQSAYKELFAGFTSLSIFLGGISVISYLFIYKNYILINDIGITHHTIVKPDFVSLENIAFIDHSIVWEGKRIYTELQITKLDNTSLKINTSYLSRKALKAICELLTTKLKDKCAEKIINMSEGKFDWYVL